MCSRLALVLGLTRLKLGSTVYRQTFFQLFGLKKGTQRTASEPRAEVMSWDFCLASGMRQVPTHTLQEVHGANPFGDVFRVASAPETHTAHQLQPRLITLGRRT